MLKFLVYIIRNSLKNIPKIYIAKSIKNMDYDQVADLTSQNAIDVFDLNRFL